MQSILWANEVFVPFIIAGARAMSSSIDALVGFISRVSANCHSSIIGKERL